MPITGKFEADFSQFSSATQKAGQDLKDFGKTAEDTTATIGDVEAATKSLTSALSSVAGAFGIGFSVSALVDLVTTVNQEAAALQNLSIATRISVEDLQVLGAATKEYGVSGDQLGNALYQLSRRIAGGDQNVASAYATMGLSMDQVKAQSGDLMQLFLATEAGLAGVRGEAQTTISQDLFGKLGNSMIAFSAGADQAVASAANYVKIAGGDSVKASAAMATEVDRATQSLHAWVMEVEGNAARILNILTKNTDLAKQETAADKDTIASKTAIWEQLQKNVAAQTELTDGMQITVGLGTQINALGTQSNAIKAEDIGKSKDQLAAEQYLNTMRLNAAKPLLDWQEQGLQQLKDWGVLTAQNAAIDLKVNADQLKAWEARVAQEKQDLADLAKANEQLNAMLLTQLKTQTEVQAKQEAAAAAHFGIDVQIQMLQQLMDAEHVHALAVAQEVTDEKAKQKILEDDYKNQTAMALQKAALEKQLADVNAASNLRAIDLQTQLNKAYGLDAQGAILLPQDAMTEYQKKIDTINTTMKDGAEKTLALAVADQQLKDALLAQAQASDVSTTAIDTNTAAKAKNASASAAASAAAAGASPSAIAAAGQAVDTSSINAGMYPGASYAAYHGINEGLYPGSVAGNAPVYPSAIPSGGGALTFNGALPGGASDPMIQMYLGMGYTLNEALMIASGQGAYIIGKSPTQLAALGFRAAGGPVSAGAAYVVGERGPELFTPGVSGAISPSLPTTGGGIQIVINGSLLATQAELADLVGQAFVAAYRRGGNRLPV